MLTIGYHTLEDRDNVDEIENFGPIKCTNKAAWLGYDKLFIFVPLIKFLATKWHLRLITKSKS